MTKLALASLTLLAAAHPAHAAPPLDWELSVAASGAIAGSLVGAGTVMHAWFAPNRYFAFGIMADVLYLFTRGDSAYNGRPYAYGVVTTYVAGVAQVRAPIGAWMPYLEVGTGGYAVSPVESENVQCSLQGSYSAHAAGGAKVRLGDNFALGLRVGGRYPAARSCALALGPGSFDAGPMVFTGSLGLHVLW